MSQYPRDEFDKVPESSARQGVHRERLIPTRSSGLGLLITVGVLALVVGLAAYFVVPRLGIGSGSADPSAAATSPTTEEAEPAAAPTPTETASEAPAESESGETAAAAPSPSPTPSEAAAVVDRTQPVTVLNASGVSGLGASVSGRVAGAGWPVGSVGNWTGMPQQASGVYYSAPEQAANAREVAAQLGIYTVMETPGFPTVTVVLGPGFQ